ncbi:uncharacterized protein LOC124698560 [Lolium rigidum]|uniref:uncharacterized protein LOC124698560 n=1 Tax=Lolium rigidum TaxID=89674 RepID=UPI001F5CE8E9|nr:uncharacterized protein LOC124698560 [Lolium rigidum]
MDDIPLREKEQKPLTEVPQFELHVHGRAIKISEGLRRSLMRGCKRRTKLRRRPWVVRTEIFLHPFILSWKFTFNGFLWHWLLLQGGACYVCVLLG